MAKKENADLVIITVPKRYKGDNRRYVSAGGEQYSVKTGVPVELPRSVARVLIQSVEQRDSFDCMCEELEGRKQIV